MDERTCMVDVAKYFLAFLVDESCGKCTPCREGVFHMHEILKRITEGEGQEGDLELLEELAAYVKSSSLCMLGGTAPNPVLSTLRYFRDEYEAHIKDKRCSALSCKPLISHYIDPTKCVGCMICLRKCPSQGVIGGKNLIHVIDQDKCNNCGTCLEVCPPKFDAVRKFSGEPAPAPIPEDQRKIVRKSKSK
jgi:NADH-quinone oxidoreductase subunit F